MDEYSPPRSIEEVEQLIQSLYQPSSPDVIARTQNYLSRLQTGPTAWQLAHQLLERPDEKVQFFGALTIIIKLNTESSTLDDEQSLELLNHLIQCYIDGISKGSSHLVQRKLSSALATYFLHLYQTWPLFLRHLILCMESQQFHPIHNISYGDPLVALNGLTACQIRAVLWVATSVVEDVNKFDLNAVSNAGLYDAVLHNLPDAAALITHAVSAQHATPNILEDSIKCLQAWTWFAQRAESRDDRSSQILRPLIMMVIESVQQNAPMIEVSLEFLTEILTTYASLLTESHINALFKTLEHQWCQDRYADLIHGDFDFDSVRFGEFLIALADSQIQILMRSNDARSHDILTSLSTLLTATGYPVVDNKIFLPTIEFWSTYAETLTDYAFSEEESVDSWQSKALSYLLRAVSNAWEKIAYPTPKELTAWDSTDRVGFSDARKDLVDLLQCTYTLAGPQLLFNFADTLLTALSASSWPKVEAAAFCLGGLADCMSEDGRCDQALASVFSSQLFTQLDDDLARQFPRVRQTCVSLIERYAQYFERNTDLLPSALNLLFRVVGEQTMAHAASKSIVRLCFSCRRHMLAEADTFLDELQRLKPSLDCLSCERLVAAIAAVTQAMPNPNDKFVASSKILRTIKDDAMDALRMQSSDTERLPCTSDARCLEDASDEEPALHMALRSLRCLASAAKGFKVPTDVPIDLEQDQVDTVEQMELARISELHVEVISVMVDIQHVFPQVTIVTELISGILRSGFSETEPGPFVLPLTDVAQYLTRHSISAPRIGLLVSTATTLISSHQSRGLSTQQEVLSGLFVWVVGLIQQLSVPEVDPELTQNVIDFVSRLVSKYPAIMLLYAPSGMVENFFHFTLRVLDGNEPLPKAASAEFWTTFVSLKNDELDLSQAQSQAMNTLGPLLCESLSRNIGGHAARSELDKLSEPLKRLVVRYPSSKSWLEASLLHPSFPSLRVTKEQKSLFVKKLVTLRGNRATNQVVRDFWLSARGTSFAYAS